MPRQTTWKTWPVVWFRSDKQRYTSSRNFTDLSIVKKRDPGLKDGICFGMCVQWLRRQFDHPDEQALDRMRYMKKRLGSATATQFLYNDNLARTNQDVKEAPESLRPRKFSCSAAAPVSRLHFEFDFDIVRPDEACAMIMLVARLQGTAMLQARQYLWLRISGTYKKPVSRMAEAMSSIFGCIPRSPPEATEYGHGIALVYDRSGSVRILEPNLGEFELGFEQIERFFSDLWQHNRECGVSIELLEMFEVTQAKEFAPAPAHLGRNWTVDGVGSG